MRNMLTALIFIFATQGIAENKQTSFGGAKLILPEPQNLCEVKNTGSTAEIFELAAALQITAQNKLLAYYENCLHLERLLDGFTGGSPEYILIVAHNPNPNKETVYKQYNARRFNEEMASYVSGIDINEIFKKVERGANQTLDDYDVDLKLAYEKPINLGVLDIGDAVFHGMVMNINDGTKDHIVGGLFSYLLLNGIPLFVCKYKPYKDRKTITDLLFESKYYAARLVYSN